MTRRSKMKHLINLVFLFLFLSSSVFAEGGLVISDNLGLTNLQKESIIKQFDKIAPEMKGELSKTTKRLFMYIDKVPGWYFVEYTVVSEEDVYYGRGAGFSSMEAALKALESLERKIRKNK